MTPDTAQQEVCEAQADALEQSWAADEAARALAASLPEGSPQIGTSRDEQGRWQIGGDREAMWALDRVAEAEAEIDRVRRNAQYAIEQIQAKAMRDEASAAHDAQFFTSKLIAYRLRLEDENPRLPKTYRLANGDISVRAGRKSVKVIDETAYLAWAVDNAPAAVTYKPKITGLKDLPRSGEQIIDANGEPVPGVVEITADPSYSVKPSSPEPEPF